MPTFSDSQNTKNQELLLRIMNKVGSMTLEDQHLLYLKLNANELSQKTRLWDNSVLPSSLSEDEIAALCAAVRKENS